MSFGNHRVTASSEQPQTVEISTSYSSPYSYRKAKNAIVWTDFFPFCSFYIEVEYDIKG